MFIDYHYTLAGDIVGYDYSIQVFKLVFEIGSHVCNQVIIRLSDPPGKILVVECFAESVIDEDFSFHDVMISAYSSNKRN